MVHWNVLHLNSVLVKVLWLVRSKVHALLLVRTCRRRGYIWFVYHSIWWRGRGLKLGLQALRVILKQLLWTIYWISRTRNCFWWILIIIFKLKIKKFGILIWIVCLIRCISKLIWRRLVHRIQRKKRKTDVILLETTLYMKYPYYWLIWIYFNSNFFHL